MSWLKTGPLSSREVGRSRTETFELQHELGASFPQFSYDGNTRDFPLDLELDLVGFLDELSKLVELADRVSRA